MARQAHHRVDYRIGPHHAWIRRKTYHLAHWWKLHRAVERFIASMRWQGRSLYEVNSADLDSLREACRRSQPYADDTTGEVWK